MADIIHKPTKSEFKRMAAQLGYEQVVHGRWEWLGPNRLVTDCMCGTCSACKVRSKYIVNTMLCPNCGARMDGGVNDEKLDAAPTVDAVEVVRCKDCEWSYDEISGLCCSYGVCVDCEVPPNFYCAEGKRKEPDE